MSLCFGFEKAILSKLKTTENSISLLTNNTGFGRGFLYSAVVGRTRHMTSLIWSRIDWLASLKIRIVGLSCTEHKVNDWEEQISTSVEYFNLLTHER